MEEDDKITDRFNFLSSAAIARLSHDERSEYYRRMIEECDDSVGYPDENDVDDDEDVEWLPDTTEDISDVEIGEHLIEYDEEYDEESNAESDTEMVTEDSFTKTNNANYFTSIDGTKWLEDEPRWQRFRAHNIIHTNQMGPDPITKNLSIQETFSCIMNTSMQDIICRCTNRKARKTYCEWNQANPNKAQRIWRDLMEEELLAYFGILFYSGCHRSNFEPIKQLWNDNAMSLYRATMSLKRFQSITRFIRFDNDGTRDKRLENDKTAAISDIFNMLNANLKHFYKPYENITVDEQLFPYRGRTKFTQYMPSKPAKYGIKLWWACDAKTFYPLNGQIYTGKKDNIREKNQGERIVKDLISIYKNSGRNITVDNFFTTLPLARDLIKMKLSLVGTLKKNKRYIPREFAASKLRPVFSTQFGFLENEPVSIYSYVPKENKAVILLSTMHHDKTVCAPKNKPAVIEYYNKTKSGVDVMDKLLGQYTTKRRTNRWPLALFYNILDIAGLATYILHNTNNPSVTTKNSARRLFVIQMAKDLCLPYIKTRAKDSKSVRSFSIKNAIESILERTLDSYNAEEQLPSDYIEERDATNRIKVKGGCNICYRTQKRKRPTRKSCCGCQMPVCVEHSISFAKCEDCCK